MAAVEDMKHVLPYVGYMALDTGTASGDWKRKLNLKTQKSWNVAIGTLKCELARSL
jgi:hypothetical protein